MPRAACLGLLGIVLLAGAPVGLPPDGRPGGEPRRLAAAEPPATRLASGSSPARSAADSSDQAAFPAAMSPEESLAAMRVRPGLVVELVAAEPLVQDPVALDWGPDGRLWVVEMGDYPNGLDGRGQPGGRVRMLEDRDGDGRFDHSSVFLDQLPFPTGVKAWRHGILVTAAPEIFYAEDQDGDGRADRRITLYQGFAPGNQQHRVNGMRWGLDNWLYVANGDSGGQVGAAGTQQRVDIRGRDLRLRPDERLLETDSGQTQFGRDRDDWGHWFGGNNSHPLWHYVLADRYLRRNPHFAPPLVRHETSQQPGAAPVYPLSRTLARFNDLDKANRFTSACSPTFYRDTLLGQAFAGNVFICEPVHNLVHRELVVPRGATFASRRADDEQQSEFLASRDNWFRPTMVRTGPDGAVWVVDMYRLVIEHPEWIPADWQRRLNLRAGDDRGRIYRVLPAGRRPSAVPPRLDKLTTAELVAALESPNGWQRDMVQQLLLWRRDPAAVEPLTALSQNSEQALARLHALATLDGLHAIDAPRLEPALRDPHAGVRRHAVRVAERHLHSDPRVVARLLELAGDPDAHVRLQVACTLGEVPDQRAAAALAQLALQPAEDNFQTWAALTSVHQANIGPILARVLDAGGDEAARLTSLRLAAQLLAIAAGLEQRELVNETLRALVAPRPDEAPGQQLARLSEVLEALAGQAAGVRRLLDPSTRGALRPAEARAREIASDESAVLAERLVAVRLLGQAHLLAADAAASQQDAQRLLDLLGPRHPPELRGEALGALERLGRDELPGQLLAGWEAHLPDLRRQVLDVLLRRENWTRELLAALREGRLQAAQIDPRRRQQLLEHRLEFVRRQAAELLADTVPSGRQEVLAAYQPAVQRPGDAARGRELFAKKCAACHRLEGVGHAVGPDLTALTDKSPAAMLVAILDPNRAVEDRFLDYQVVTADGRVWSGMLAGETGNAITLQTQDGKQQPILRGQIELLRTTGKSFMPEGIERELTVDDVAAVIAYVRGVQLDLRGVRLVPPP